MSAYYKRLGSLLAVMYLLCGSDIHFENVIAAGEHPIIVDLECLFTPIVDMRHNQEEFITDSFLVIDTFFLPMNQMVGLESMGVDLSAFGGKGGELAPHTYIAAINPGKDYMSVERKQIFLEQQENIPRLNETVVEPNEFQNDFIEGFTETYYIFLKKKEFLISDKSVLEKFNNIKTRAVIRNTASYSKLLMESYHPKILYSQIEWDNHFAWLNEEINSIRVEYTQSRK